MLKKSSWVESSVESSKMSKKALVRWESDKSLSVINIEAVLEGKPETGERVKANYQKKTYAATILEIGMNN